MLQLIYMLENGVLRTEYKDMSMWGKECKSVMVDLLLFGRGKVGTVRYGSLASTE